MDKALESIRALRKEDKGHLYECGMLNRYMPYVCTCGLGDEIEQIEGWNDALDAVLEILEGVK